MGGIGSIWLSEVLTSYQDAAARAGEIVAHVTIVVLDHDPNQAIELIQKLAHSNPGTVVLPASRSADSGLILKAIRAGAREFLTLPAEQSRAARYDLAAASRPQRVAQTQTQGPRIITVTGAAGGVGCTTLAVNLAAAWLASKEHETILLDLDLMFGGVDAYLDMPPDHTLTHVVQSFDRLDLTLLKRSITRHASGLYVLAAPHRDSGGRRNRSGNPATALRPVASRLFDGRDRYQQGTSVVRFLGVRALRRDPGRRPARPALPAETRRGCSASFANTRA